MKIARYVDDFHGIIERQVQFCLNKLTKTVSMLICQKRGLHLDPQLFVDKNSINVVEQTRILRVMTGGYPLYPI